MLRCDVTDPSMRAPLLTIAAALAVASCDSAPVSTDTEVTLLVAVTPGVAAAYHVEALVARAIAETNLVYRNSQTGAHLVPVGIIAVASEPTDRMQALRELLDPDDGVMDAVHVARDRLEADLVLLVTHTPRMTVNASVMARPETAFVMVQDSVLGAPNYVLAHEIAHLHGARHTLAQDPSLEPFPWGHAFTNETIRTVAAGGSQRMVPYFSNPDLTVEGVRIGSAEHEDMARVVRESARYLANFRGPQQPTEFVPPGHWPVLGEPSQPATREATD